MKRKVSHSVVALILGAFVFMQASVVLALCDMEAPVLGQVMKHESEDCCQPPAQGDPINENVCVAHCASDFQAAGVPVVLVGVGAAPLLAVFPGLSSSAPSDWRLHYPPPPAVPPRILYQSFLI
jgi:hypothetical protein